MQVEKARSLVEPDYSGHAHAVRIALSQQIRETLGHEIGHQLGHASNKFGHHSDTSGVKGEHPGMESELGRPTSLKGVPFMTTQAHLLGQRHVIRPATLRARLPPPP